jgi:hypothetical protein
VKWVGVDDADCLPMEACAEKIPHLLIKFFEDRRVGLITEAESHEDKEMDNEYLKTKGLESDDEDEEEPGRAMPQLSPAINL